MVLPERDFGKMLSNVFSITYNTGGKPGVDREKDPFAKEMNAGLQNPYDAHKSYFLLFITSMVQPSSSD